MTITPAILTDSFLELQQQIDMVKYSAAVEAVHIDVIDGQFVENTTVTPMDLTVGEFDPLKIDFHFMTEEPMDFVYECEAMQDYLPIRRIIAQIERMSYQQDFVREVKLNTWEPVLALDLFTPLEEIEPDVWPELNHVLLMGIEAGFQGRQLQQHLFDKMKEFALLPEARHVKIIVDGGVKLTNVKKLSAAGAAEFSVGSAIWSQPDPLIAIEEFERLAPAT